MTDLNQVMLCGRLGADPEIRRLQNGGRVANFSLATADHWKDKNSGERKERTEWHRVVVWNEGLVGVIEQYLKKGSQVLVRGKLQTRKWQAQDGTDRYSTEIVLQGFDAFLQMLGGGDNQGNNSQGGRAAAHSSRSHAAQKNKDHRNNGGNPPLNQSSYSNDLDDEVPF